MKLEISKNANPNYLAKVIKVSNIRKHHNADRLQIITIDGNNVIVDLNMKLGDVVVYFPAESCIADWFLKKYNQYRDKTMNENSNESGFFEANRRVKALMLREERSCGIVFPINKFTSETNVEKYVDVEFDTIDGQLICEKYVPKYIKTQSLGNKVGKNRNKSIKKLSKVIEDQFRFHIDTVHFGKNIHKFMLDDVISITLKMDGCVKHDTLIDTLEYGKLTIKNIVDNKINCHIKAYNTETNEIVYVPIDQYYTIPDDGEWYKIELEDGTTLTITGNNPVWLPEMQCYRRVDELNGDEILMIDKS